MLCVTVRLADKNKDDRKSGGYESKRRTGGAFSRTLHPAATLIGQQEGDIDLLAVGL